MTENARKKLRLIPYHPNDYSLGDVLVKNQVKKIDSEQYINSVFSLFFQWPEHRKSIVAPIPDSSSFFDCQISFDSDERQPSLLFVEFPNTSDGIAEQIGDRIKVRFEIFRSCYEFQSQIEYISQDKDNKRLTISLPQSISLLKHRKLPRVEVSGEQAQLHFHGTAWMHSEENSQQAEVEILELGLLSLLTSSSPKVKLGNGKINIRGKSFFAECIRADENCAVFVFKFETGRQAGEFFDIYKIVAYPSLKSRHECPLADGLKLLHETGYLTKYNSSDLQKRCDSDLIEVWSSTKSIFHELGADYYTTDEESNITGTSSATVCFIRDNHEVWSFHQLCATTDPNLLEQSGSLYTWRAEYLAARPESFEVFSRYTSKSRWLERIYTKFAGSSSNVSLYPVRSFQVEFSRSSAPTNLRSTTISFGKDERICVDAGPMLGAAFPTLLNAANNMDAIVSLDSQASFDDFQKVSDCLMDAAGVSKIDLFLTTTNSSIDVKNVIHQSKVDRVIQFSKDSLVDFIGCVEHSIAITKRKITDEQ